MGVNGIPQEREDEREAAAREELKMSDFATEAERNTMNRERLTFPDSRSSKEAFTRLLDAVATEEAAISHLIHAQAGQIEAFTGSEGNYPTAPTNQQINDFQNGVTRMLELLVEKQKLLVRMVELSKRLMDESGDGYGR
ncbi:hypothetical protein ACFPVX_16890 [Cohnella faecalis]|uniref:Uncharacterized protein n=1 Tax=Cohnella faecalis TaxID=2315694 RepID=A0A398CKJ1_9BACL|nr:hypothetical protein [Cohnella faecalis]RIE02820.1 hypothetical protein D3H35_19500 [Cohnella faecalis]